MRELRELLFEHDELADLDPAARRLAIRDLVASWGEGAGLAEAVGRAADFIDGYGPLTGVMTDDVTDVLVNGPDQVYVERARGIERCDISFASAAELRSLVDRLLARANSRADASRPIADGRLPDGSRIHVVLPPVAPDGPLLSIRRFPRRSLTLDDLRARGTATDEEADVLAALVARRATLIVSGATGSGKTTLLNALLSLVPPSERVVTIEETPELRSACEHAVSLITRPPNVEGKGALDATALVRAALRMRPDRIVIGEVRGPEALDALAALATGHRGSMLTVHARSARDALDRLVELALGAGSGAREESIAARVRRAVDAVVHLERDSGGRRRVRQILEVK
ncbi:MAG: CpaF family protein [Actinomycetota bacterium]